VCSSGLLVVDVDVDVVLVGKDVDGNVNVVFVGEEDGAIDVMFPA
jgi:hypothetical protein